MRSTIRPLTARLSAVSLVCFHFAAPASAETSPVGEVTHLDGTALITRTSVPAGTPLNVRDPVFQADRITTGEASLARILLGGKALVTVRERSVLTIAEIGDVSTIDVTLGRIGIDVMKEHMPAPESVQMRTPNAIVAIRGTVVMTEVSRGAATDTADAVGAFTTTITVLEGSVDVRQLDGVTRQAVGPTHSLGVLQRMLFTGVARPSPVQRITREAGRRLLHEFRVEPRHLPARGAGVTEGHPHRATAPSRGVESSTRPGLDAPAQVGSPPARRDRAARPSGGRGSAGQGADRRFGVGGGEPPGKAPADRARTPDSKLRFRQHPSRR
jgi:hypothetical protein